MVDEKGLAHRPGAFKQTNKDHKHGRHRSKRSISSVTKGKVSVKALSKRKKTELNRNERRHQATQSRQKKREELLAKKRCLGGLDYAPFLISVVPLVKGLDTSSVVQMLSECDSEIVCSKSATVTHICVPRFKQRFALINPATDNDLAVLDSLKVSDTVLFVISAAGGVEDESNLIDRWGTNILNSAFAQGIPTPIVAITDLETIVPKKRHEFKQTIQKLISKWFPDDKLMVLDQKPDGLNILRKISNQKKKTVLYRDRRPYMYAESVDYIPDEKGTMGTLKLTGYLRGTPLDVNGLVHIPGLGDFQMGQIDAPNDPHKIDKSNRSGADAMESDESAVRVVAKADPSKQESLDSENVPDPLDAEQTWPTNEEIAMAEAERKQQKVKKVPKGWSEYQAAWIPDDDAAFQSDASESSDEDEFMDAMSEEQSEDDEEKNFDTVTESEVAVNDDKYDQDMDIYAEKEALLKLNAAKSDLQFPDEIDTPQDQPARTRFQKYRGMESFRTSPWNPKENLPSDYARIFQFQNFDRTKRRVLRDAADRDGALPGWYVTVHILNVSELLWTTFKATKAPVVLIGLFAHEHKMSVLNVALKRTQNHSLPIKSKDRLIFQCGYRRFVVNPIFSAHTNGAKHKFERYFQPESTAVATFYAPIQFPSAPVLCYKEINNELVLVATGNLISCNPNRLVIKRLLLSGHPLKINKRSAVIRFMFFNREDIVYFKPCRLTTKMGRIGHIKEPLGTHGHMKCVFDGQLASQDTVLLSLYKRVFPKWSFEHLVVSCSDTMET